jgi:hypothetical protein
LIVEENSPVQLPKKAKKLMKKLKLKIKKEIDQNVCESPEIRKRKKSLVLS